LIALLGRLDILVTDASLARRNDGFLCDAPE